MRSKNAQLCGLERVAEGEVALQLLQQLLLAVRVALPAGTGYKSQPVWIPADVHVMQDTSINFFTKFFN